MENLSKLNNIKEEPSEEKENLTEMPTDIVKEESVLSNIFIKTEPQDDESKFQVVGGTSYKTSPIHDMGIKPDEPMVEIAFENHVDDLIQDPLDVSTEINVGGHYLSELEEGMTFKMEGTEEEEEHHLMNDGELEVTEKGKLKNKKRVYKNNHVCNVCYKTFPDNSHLNDHIRTHTREKPFSCNMCEKLFSQKRTLIAHMLVHSDERSHTCDVCNKSFRRKADLASHKMIHTGDKPFKCFECNGAFRSKYDLTVHIRTHTGEKPFTCNICEKSFHIRNTLVTHMLIHKNDMSHKPHACDQCKAAFSRRNALIVHKRIHTGEKPFSCNVCKKSFSRNTNLVRHMLVHRK